MITTKKSHATITLEWLRTKVSQRCFGSGVRTGPPLRRYLPTVRGETRMVSFTFSSLAMRSSPHVGFSAAICRISFRRMLRQERDNRTNIWTKPHATDNSVWKQ